MTATLSTRYAGTISTRNVLTVWRRSTDAQRRAGEAWYRQAHAVAESLSLRTGRPVTTCAGVIAATSPLNPWLSNVRLATRYLTAGRADGGYLGIGVRRAAAILSGADPLAVMATPTSAKIRNFYRSIVSGGTDADAVCIDRHAIDIAMGVRHRDAERPAVTPTRYRLAAEAYRRAALVASRETGRTITAAQVQATTWLAWRETHLTAHRVEVFGATGQAI